MAYDIDKDTDLDLPPPFTRQHMKIYDLLMSDKAFNTDCFDQTILAGRAMYDMAKLIKGLNLSQAFNDSATTLYNHTQGPMTQLEMHLSAQFANLTTNLALLDSYINDMAHIERLPGYNDLTQSGFVANTAGDGGSYTYMMSGVSPRAMMAPSLSPVFMADTGTGGLTSPGTQQVFTPGYNATPALSSTSFTGTSGTIVPGDVATNNVSPYAFAGNYNVGNVGNSYAYGGNALSGSADTSATPDQSINSFGSGGWSDTSSGGSSGGGSGGSGGGSGGSSSGSSPNGGSDGSSGGGSGGGSGGPGASSGGACGSMASGLGSILGKASQLMGGLGGLMGQMQGLMGSLMGGGILNAIGRFGNLGQLAQMVPGLGSISGLQGIVGSIGNLAGGNFNIGNLTSGLGQIGGLISQVGQFANIGALGSTLTGMLGGAGSALGNLTKIGNVISSIGAMMPATQAIQGPPVLASYSPYAVSNQLNTLVNNIQTADFGPCVAEIRTVVSLISTLMNVPVGAGTDALALQFPTLQQSQIAIIGGVQDLLVQLTNLADYLSVAGNQAYLGDITPTLTFLTNFANSLSNYIAPSPDITNLQVQIRQLVVYLTPLNNLQPYLAQVQTTANSLYNFGGQTGFGNVGNTLAQMSGIVSKVTGMLGVPGLGGLMNGITSLPTNIGSLAGSLTNILPGNITSVLGGISGLTNQLGSLANGIGLGNMGSMIGQLGNLGGVGGLLQGGLGSLLTNAGSLAGMANPASLLQNFGGLGSILGQGGLGSIAGSLGGLLGGAGGGIGGIMGGIGSMIGGESSMMKQASRSLSAVAGTFNVMALKNSGCAGGALGNLASGAMQNAMGGTGNDGSPGSSSGGGGSGAATDGASAPNAVDSNDLDSMLGSDIDSTLTDTAATPPSRPSDGELQQYGKDYGDSTLGTYEDGQTPLPPSRPSDSDLYYGGSASDTGYNTGSSTLDRSGSQSDDPADREGITAGEVAAANAMGQGQSADVSNPYGFSSSNLVNPGNASVTDGIIPRQSSGSNSVPEDLPTVGDGSNYVDRLNPADRAPTDAGMGNTTEAQQIADNDRLRAQATQDRLAANPNEDTPTIGNGKNPYDNVNPAYKAPEPNMGNTTEAQQIADNDRLRAQATQDRLSRSPNEDLPTVGNGSNPYASSAQSLVQAQQSVATNPRQTADQSVANPRPELAPKGTGGSLSTTPGFSDYEKARVDQVTQSRDTKDSTGTITFTERDQARIKQIQDDRNDQKAP